MKLIPIFLFAAVIAMSSCSSAYKTSQTPDDVYYSPGQQRSSDNYSNNNRSRNDNNNDQDEYYNANPNDQYLAMKVQDPQRWSTFDDYGYDAYYPSTTGYGGYGSGGYYGGMYSPYGGYGLGLGFGNPYFGFYNSYYAWNAFYNPYYYYGNVVYVGGKGSTYNSYTSLHPFNAAAYRNNTFSNRNSRVYSPNNNFNNRNGNTYVQPNTTTRSTFYNNNQNNNRFNNNSNRTFTQPTRSYTPAPASTGGGGGGSRSSGGGGGGFSRPGKP